MKIIFQILAILVIAALVAAGFYLAFGGSGTNSQQFAAGSQLSSRGFEGRNDRGGSPLTGTMGVLSNLLEISALVALVLFIQNALKYYTGRRAAASQQ